MGEGLGPSSTTDRSLPPGLSFLACTEGEHNPYLTPSKGLNEAFVRERVWKSFANYKVQCTQAG